MSCRTLLLGVILFTVGTNWAFAGKGAEDKDKMTVEEGLEFLEKAAENSRKEKAELTFEEFKKSVYKEPFEGGKFIVNGDVAISNEKELYIFFTESVQKKKEPQAIFTIYNVGGLDKVWSNSEKRALTYCISSKEFGPRYPKVVASMEQATGAWETVADINFIHLSAEDESCDASNSEVVFDVRPVNYGAYLARAFFPNELRVQRNILIDESSFDLNPNGNLSLVGVLRHELGHTIGARHEHVRPDAGTCFEDDDWRSVTDYDAFSVMHYPQCNGLGDWSLTLTEKDRQGVACIYGPAPGFIIDPGSCHGGQNKITTKTYDEQKVASKEEKQYGPFPVVPGTPFNVIMKGVGSSSGDPDLYLSFHGTPTVNKYDCRPYTVGADEECSVDVPVASFGGAQVNEAHIMVRGYTAGSYRLSVTYTAP